MNYLKKAMDIIIKARRAKSIKEKDDLLDALWELIVNASYECQRRWHYVGEN